MTNSNNLDENSVILKARKFLKECNIDSAPIEINKYLNAVNAEIHFEDFSNDNESGQTTHIKGIPHIFVNSNHSNERQRFTILHELGHIILGIKSDHSHSISFGSQRPEEEKLCDIFAAECLLPKPIFSKDVDDCLADLQEIQNLGEKYQASLQATGSRFVFFTEEPCAWIISNGKEVTYASTSKTLKEKKIYIDFKMMLPTESLAFNLTRGTSTESSLDIDTEVWFNKKISCVSSVYEQSMYFDEYNQTITLLTLNEEENSNSYDFEEYDEDEQPLLEELSGELPWPSKSRRKR